MNENNKRRKIELNDRSSLIDFIIENSFQKDNDLLNEKSEENKKENLLQKNNNGKIK